MTIVLDQNGNPVEAGNVAGELISLRSENAKLKAELAAETKKFEAAITTNERLLSDVRCANYELAAAQKDAERYRWATEHLRIGEFNNTTDDSNGFQDYSDAAIDKEMAK